MDVKLSTQGTKTFVSIDGKVAGIIRRVSVEVPARNTYFPATVTRIEWQVTLRNLTVRTFTTRKAAVAAIVEQS